MGGDGERRGVVIVCVLHPPISKSCMIVEEDNYVRVTELCRKMMSRISELMHRWINTGPPRSPSRLQSSIGSNASSIFGSVTLQDMLAFARAFASTFV